MRTRPATIEDLDDIFDIYEREVRESVATLDLDPFGPVERREWFDRHGTPAHPAIVMEEDGVVIAWASLSRFSQKRAYDRTAEVSVYVHENHRGKGVGRALLSELIRLGREAELGVLIARIAAEQVPSLGLHLALGFQHVGTLRRVGEKLGRVLDVELLDYQFDANG